MTNHDVEPTNPKPKDDRPINERTPSLNEQTPSFNEQTPSQTPRRLSPTMLPGNPHRVDDL